MTKQLLFLVLAIPMNMAVAKPSCLFEGDYPFRMGVSTKERVDYIRARMKDLDQLKKMRSRATLIEGIADWLPQGCENDYLEYLEAKIFQAKPIRFNPELFGRLNGAGKVRDLRESMPLKSRLLLKLFRTPESDFTAWEDDNDVGGGPTVIPQPSSVKLAVARWIAKSNLVLNVEEMREFLETDILRSRDYELRHALQPAFERLLHFRKANLINVWTAELPELLQRRSTNVYPYWTALQLVEALGANGAVQAKPLLEDIVKKEGKFPLTDQVHNGPRDLAAEAARALARLK